VEADATRLRRALENLLSNALKYSEGPVELGLTRINAEYLLDVSDEGIGIPSAEQGSLFEPFFRASNTAGKPGHGLGLCVVRSCIEEHGGTVQFTSEIDRGCTFSIALPVSSSDRNDMRSRCAQSAEPRLNVGQKSGSLPFPPRVVAPVPERVKGPLADQAELDPSNAISPHSINAKAGEKFKAVIVDDDPIVRNIMRELLAASDDVLILGEAGTIAHARRLAREHKPTVFFLDIHLPDGSGFDLLPDLDSDASVVFVTSAEDYAAQAFDCAAVDYLVKPVSSERLQKAIQRVRQRLERKQSDCPASNPGTTGSFVVKTLTEKRVVKINEVRSILAYGEYSWIYWEQGKKGALLRKSLKQWQSELPTAQFIRVHRRAIINLEFLERIERLSNGRLQLFLHDTPEPIMVSLSQTSVLNRRLKSLRLQ
jgi:two-component system, LytTR family, response regulator